MMYKNRLSRYVAGGVLALAALSFQASAVTYIGSISEFESRVVAGVADSFVLTADIDCGGDKNIRRIGGLNNPFTGKLNGNGHTIHNFEIDASGREYVGLFGYVGKDAVIENLGVIATAVKGSLAVGVLAGGNDGTIRRCFSKGSVIASGNSAGGLVGLNGGFISESYSEASVRGNKNVGGLVGMQTVNVSGAGVADCYAKDGAVTGESNVGGLVGYVFGGSVRQCLAAGKVTGTSNKGGLIGFDYGSTNSGWKTSGKTGSGETVQKANIVSSFWNTQTTGQSASAGSTGKNFAEGISTAQMINVNTYDDNWKRNVWVIGGNGPRLLNVLSSDPSGGTSIAGATVTLDKTSFTYNGLKQQPQVTVSLEGKTLKVNTEYIVEVINEDNGDDVSAGVNVGTATIRIHGFDEYSGDIYKTYTITKAQGVAVASPQLDGTPTSKSVKIKPVSVAGQQVEYSIDGGANWQTGLEFGGLKQNTAYYIVARSKGDRNHDAGEPSSSLEVTTGAPTEYSIKLSADKESVTSGESVTLFVDVESPYSGGDFYYNWYVNTFSPDTNRNNNTLWEALSGGDSIYNVSPSAPANYYYQVQVVHFGRDDGNYQILWSGAVTVTVNAPAAPELGKKTLSSAAAASGALVRGRTLVMSSPSASGVSVRLIDMRGRTAARFVSGRGASFSLSGLPVGRYIMEVRDRGRRVSALPVFLK